MAKKAAKEESPAKTETKKSGITKPMKLSSDLAAVVGQKQASRAECIKQLWAYLKKNNLQDPDNKHYFIPFFLSPYIPFLFEMLSNFEIFGP